MKTPAPVRPPPHESRRPSAAGLRRRAESRLTAAAAGTTSPRLARDAQRLLHELQVHQVELQLQNTELLESRARAEELLEKYTDLYDFAPVGYFSLSADGRIRLVNLAAARLAGLERSRLLGRPFESQLLPAARAGFRAFLARVFATAGRQACEVGFATTGPTPRFIRLEAVRDARGTECRLAATDITERKEIEAAQRREAVLAAANREAQREIARREALEASLRIGAQTERALLAESRRLHAQMRHLTRQVLSTQEEERKLISRELHDEVAQILAGINVQLATLTEAATIRPAALRRSIVRTQRMVERSVRIVHRYARKLRPAMLDDLGLIPALRSFIRDLAGRKGLHVRLVAFPAVEALDNQRRTVLYRVAQEALTNVVRHAHARHATVRIARTRDAVHLAVHDDGRSFPVARLLASSTSKRLGLLGMRERVEMVGGRFAIESSRGHGTTVRAKIPFSETPPPRPS